MGPGQGFDSVVLTAVLRELDHLVGGRVVRVAQPGRAEVVLTVRARRAMAALLISIHPEHARLHLTRQRPPASGYPLATSAANGFRSPFVQLLRRYLQGARLLKIEGPPFERLVSLHFGTLEGPVQLVAELMGRHSNLILVREAMVIGSMKTVTAELSRSRQIYPGAPYLPPPTSGHPNPGTITEGKLAEGLRKDERPLWKALTAVVRGIGSPLARELIVRSGMNPEEPGSSLRDVALLLQKLRWLAEVVAEGAFNPSLYLDHQGNPVAFAPFPFTTFAHLTLRPATMSEAIEAVYGAIASHSRVEEERASLKAIVGDRLHRINRAVTELHKTLEEARDAERLRMYGELILAYKTRIPPGAPEAVVPGYADPQEEVKIPLHPHLSAVENARRYFKRYSRLRTALRTAEERLTTLQEEQRYLESVLFHLQQAADLDDLAEIRRELEKGGYLRGPRTAAPKAPARPRAFRTADGFTILVGRSNKENDHLTFHIARPTDLWFHARGVPGAHVILQTADRTTPAEAVESAARLAAYYSQARASGNVAVDYTERRYVRRPARRRPGMVLYERERTIWVTPTIPPDLESL